MATLSSPSPAHCSSSSIGVSNHIGKRVIVSSIFPRRFASQRFSLQTKPLYSNAQVLCMQDGAVAAPIATIENDSPVKKQLKDGLLSVGLPEDQPVVAFSNAGNGESTVSITVVGASGDLAKKKIFPALFALYYEGYLPEHFTVIGYARSKMTDAELRLMVSKTLT